LLVSVILFSQNTLFGQIYLHGPSSGSNTLKRNLLEMPSDVFTSSISGFEQQSKWEIDFGYQRPFQQKYLDIRHLLIQFSRLKSSFAVGFIQTGDEYSYEHLIHLNISRTAKFGFYGLGISHYRLRVSNYPIAALMILQPALVYHLNGGLSSYLIIQFYLRSNNLFDSRIDPQSQNMTYGLSYTFNKHLKTAIEATTLPNAKLDFRSQLMIKPNRLPVKFSFGYGFLRQQALFGLLIYQKKLNLRISISTHPYLPISQQYSFAVKG
jgi:hypothetical protein